ncbi:hypothetical protein ACA910_019195 [Epithemia clementina (nom. ined.)]
MLSRTVLLGCLLAFPSLAMASSSSSAAPVERQFIDLLGDATFPEAILAIDGNKLMVGGFGDGSLQLVDLDYDPPRVEYFNAPGDNGMIITVGFVYDAKRDYLWVANFDFVLGSQLKVFSYTRRQLIATIPSPDEFVTGSFFNELTMASDGTIYVSDTFNPTIWTASPRDLTTVQPLVTDPLLLNPEQPFGLNGLALTPNEKYLVASVMDRLDAGDGRLVRISLDGDDDRQVSNVVLRNKYTSSMAVENFAGSDGMIFLKNQHQRGGGSRRLVMVHVYSPAGAIITADFTPDYAQATLVVRDSMPAFEGVYNRPTASDVLGDKWWTINSQLDHIIDDANGAVGTPPDLPFQLVGVPLKALGLQPPKPPKRHATSSSTTMKVGKKQYYSPDQNKSYGKKMGKKNARFV